MTTSESAGLYVHVPFCEKLCPYCDFTVFVRSEIPDCEYTDALIHDLTSRRVPGWEFDTLYVGGGTPSLWRPESLRRFVESARLGPLREFTIEANPNDISPDWLRSIQAAGVTRLSIGVQSFDDSVLQQLGRAHDGARARSAVVLAAEANLTVSVDLIYGGPSYSDDVLRADVETVVQSGVDHVSVYELTIEPGTVFARLARAGTLGDAGPDERFEFGRSLGTALTEAGFERYEVSSFARPGCEAVHNSRYWRGDNYLGVGVGAHSFFKSKLERQAVSRDLKRYLTGELVVSSEELTPREHWFERCMTAVRTRFWLDLQDLAAEFGTGQFLEPTIKALDSAVELGWSNSMGRQYRTTDRGLDFADEIASIVLDHLEP